MIVAVGISQTNSRPIGAVALNPRVVESRLRASQQGRNDRGMSECQQCEPASQQNNAADIIADGGVVVLVMAGLLLLCSIVSRGKKNQTRLFA